MTLLRLLYSFWPLVFLAGWLPNLIGFGRSRPSLRSWVTRVFIAWILWAIIGISLAVNQIESFLIPEPINSALFVALGILLSAKVAFPSVKAALINRQLLLQAREIEDLQILPPDKFEALISAYFSNYGFRTNKVGRSGDHGIDLLVYNDIGEKWVVQCKRYRGSIGEPILRDLYGSMHHENASRAFLMTTGTFTQAAYAWARDKPITLYDGAGLIRLLRRVQQQMKRKI